VNGDASRRIDPKGDQVFVIAGLVSECIVAVDNALILECVSFLLVTTT